MSSFIGAAAGFVSFCLCTVMFSEPQVLPRCFEVTSSVDVTCERSIALKLLSCGVLCEAVAAAKCRRLHDRKCDFQRNGLTRKVL